MSVGKIIGRLLGLPVEEGLRPAAVILSDHGRQFQVILDPDLPDDAYEQLFQLDLSFMTTGILSWDRRSGEWRSQ